MVSASTGSGKTAAFILPALTGRDCGEGRQHQAPQQGRDLRPTRPGACAQRVSWPCRWPRPPPFTAVLFKVLRVATIVGGVPYSAQIAALRGPLDVLISTPGRLLDHMQSGKAVLENVEMLVLDEADRMLDMGFIDDIHAIAEAIPKERQTLDVQRHLCWPCGSPGAKPVA